VAVCSSYQIDFSAKTFGLCHCGRFRKDHGSKPPAELLQTR
jgi:hypothetical protein